MPLLAEICIAPRRVMRSILDQAVRPPALPVVIAAMISFSLRDIDVSSMSEVAESFGLSSAILLAIAVLTLIVVVAIVFYYAIAAAATAAGRFLLEGRGTWRDVRHAIAWGLAPQVWAMFFRLPALLFWPGAVAALSGRGRKIQIGDVTINQIVTPDVPLYQILIVACLELGFLGWYLAVGSHTLAEAQGFSAVRGLLNLVLAVILPFVAILVIVIAAVLTWGG